MQVSHRDGRVVLDAPETELAKPEFCTFTDAYIQRVPRDFEGIRGLPGFSLNDFNLFWGCLVRWALVALAAFVQGIRSGHRQEECLPTQVLEKERFAVDLANLAGIKKSSCDSIISVLTFDGRTNRPDVFQQPFFVSDGTICWSPQIAISSRFQRNLIKLLSRTKEMRAIIDASSSDWEIALIKDVRSLLEKRGFQTKERLRVSSTNEEAEIDLLAWKQNVPTEVLIIEIKAVVPPDEINEVNAVTETLIEGQSQVRRIFRILKASSPARTVCRMVPWEKITRIFGIVLTRESTPNPRFDYSEIPAGTLDIISSRLTNRDFKTPSRMHRALIDRDWLVELVEAERFPLPVQIGEITYHLPGFGIDRLE
jgi:hypothetical protein